MSNIIQQRNNYFIVAFIFSLVGGLILLFSNFGWWYNYNYYSGYRENGWVAVSIDQPLSSLIIIFVALCVFFGTYVSFTGFRESAKIDELKKNVSIALLTSAIAFGIVVLGAIVFVALVIGADDWGLDFGFYGGFVGSGIELLMFYLLRQSLR